MSLHRSAEGHSVAHGDQPAVGHLPRQLDHVGVDVFAVDDQTDVHRGGEEEGGGQTDLPVVKPRHGAASAQAPSDSQALKVPDRLPWKALSLHLSSAPDRPPRSPR